MSPVGQRVRRTAFALLVAVLTGCGGGDPPAAGGADPSASSGGLSGRLTVFAAASLTETFEQLAAVFEDQHSDVTVRLNFGASSALAQQVLQGAPADVFAAASEATMRQVSDAGLTEGPSLFTSNVLQVAVPAGNPGQVTGLADLGRAELDIALCAEQVPCGAAARQLLAAVGVTARPDTLERDVKATLTKVELGEVDAALVYRTDVLAAGDPVTGIAVPEADVAANRYPIAVLAAAPNRAAADAFVALVRGPAGQRVLEAAGFRPP